MTSLPGGLMKRFLFWLTGRLPCRIIADKGVPYLERYFLGTVFGTTWYIHRFVGSDPDRGEHNHPWRWAFSLVLSGGYFEMTRSGIRRVRWFNWLTDKTFHRVILHNELCEIDITPFPELLPEYSVKSVGCRPKPCWTLFCHQSKRIKPWGFLRKDGAEELFVPHPSAESEWWKTAPLGNATADRQR